MEMPTPAPEHRRLEKLAGRYHAKETVQPSKWTEEMTDAESTTENRTALDGFAIVQDYEQRQANGIVVRGHGVFRYDAASDTYELHWFTSLGDPPSVFRGGFEGKVMTLTSRHGGGWMRLVYDFNLRGGYRLRMDMSDDGEHWERIVEGDNLMATNGARRTAAKKAPVKKAGVRKTGTRSATGKTAAKKKKTAAKKASAKKAAASKKTAGKKTKKRAATTKSVAKKTAAKKAAPGRTAAKKKTGTTTARTAAKPRVPAAEKRRRQASTAGAKTAPRRKTTRPAGASAREAGAGGVTQQRSKGAAQKGPRMPAVHKTSTRVGWHKTAAKGTRTQ